MAYALICSFPEDCFGSGRDCWLVLLLSLPRGQVTKAVLNRMVARDAKELQESALFSSIFQRGFQVIRSCQSHSWSSTSCFIVQREEKQ